MAEITPNEEAKLPDPGVGRIWVGKHQPTKSKTPLRLELRERINPDSPNPVVIGLTRVIAYADTIALPLAVRDTAFLILERASRVDEFVGVLDHEGSTK